MSYMGFRLGTSPKQTINIKHLKNCKVLTSLQHKLIQDRLDACTISKKVEELTKDKKVKKDKEGNPIMVEEIKIVAEPHYIANLVELLDRPYNEAKVDHLGKDWEKIKEPTPEEIKEINKETIKQKNRKGKSRKDLEKENEK